MRASEGENVATNPIRRDCLYVLDEFKAVMKWGDRAMRSARRDGLKVRYVGGRAYVLGEDVIEWIRQQNQD